MQVKAMETVQSAPILQLVIMLQTGTGAFQVAWPNVDPITKLGMLEAAKAYLLAELTEAMNKAKSGIVMPPPGTRVS